MKEQTKNSSLPQELLRLIFQFAQKGKSELLLVCKSWHFAAIGFFGDKITVRLNDNRFNSLLNDLLKYPKLATKIEKMRISHSSLGEENPIVFQSILNSCTNMTELQFDSTLIYHYLKIMNTTSTVLPNIQKIYIPNLSVCSPAIRRFGLWVNYRFRTTINHIDIVDVEMNDALKDYGGLKKYTSMFPNLIYLEAHCHREHNQNSKIDLTALLSANKSLKTLKLYDLKEVTSVLNELPESEAVDYESLTTLELQVCHMNIQLLEYIYTRFKNMNDLQLLITQINPNPKQSTAESDAIFEKFKDYSTGLERIYASYVYNGKAFFMNNGGKHHNVESIVLDGALTAAWMHDHSYLIDLAEDNDYDDYDDDLGEDLDAEDHHYTYFGDDLEIDDFDHVDDEYFEGLEDLNLADFADERSLLRAIVGDFDDFDDQYHPWY